MKKSKILRRTAAIILAVVMLFSFASCGGGYKEEYKESEYQELLKGMNFFDNRYDQALPQTIIYKIVTEHFASPLPEGKTAKKAIFLGYDGFRADGLLNIKDDENSAVMKIKNQGGLYHSFSGGIAGGEIQATSTAPSWAAMLTGGWAEYNGIDDNGKYKNEEAKTFLTELAEQGKSISFTTSWREHTSTTYLGDTVYAIEKGFNATYSHQPDDAGTLCRVLKHVAKPQGMEKIAKEDPDVIFFTLEHTDHAGHGTGFGNNNENYIKACKEADAYGAEIIKTIEERSTYATEDWLIIIGTDHGGFETHHGEQTPQERSTWLACNKKLEMSEENLNFAKTK